MIPFISDDDLSAYLGTTVTEADLIVTIALDAACQVVRDELRRNVNLEADDEVTLSGTGIDSLVLPQWPLSEVADVTLDDVSLTVDTDYLVDPERGVLYRVNGVWTVGHLNVVVTYSHGYALDESQVSDSPPIERVPSSVRLVALQLAAAIWRSAGPTSATDGTITSETIGSYSYTIDAETVRANAATYLTDDMRLTLGAHATTLAP